MRFDDTRTQAARYVEETVPAGESVGIATTSETFRWTCHAWRYPRINFRIYREASFADRPTVVTLSSYDFKDIEAALSSPKLLKGYRWDERYAKDWFLFSPPSPRLFRFYDELLGGTGGG